MASTAQSTQSDILNLIFQSLKSKNHDVRLQAAIDLRRYVATTTAEISSDAVAKLWDDNISHRLFELVHSQSIVEKLGGLLAIDHLLDIEGEETIESKRNLFRLYNYVKSLLPNPDVNIMLAASKTLGQIAEIGGAAFGERFMDFEVPAAIALLEGDKQESSRYAGVLILKELARNSPTYFHSHSSIVFDKILVPLRDQRVIVREGAAELLAACLEIVTQRERQVRSPYLQKILQDAQLGLKFAQPEVIHGSLLTYRELLLHGGMFMKETFLDTADQILRFKTHRDGLVRKMVITLIPTLAAYDTQTFTEHFLHKAMAHLLSQLDKPNERSFAFIAIGHTAHAVGSDMKPFLESIMGHIKTGLQMRGKKNAPSEEPIFQCVGMLASAVGPNLTKLLHDQLDLMFACGLSGPLAQALVAIAHEIPPLLKTIQDRLLDLLSQILSGQPYRPLGAPSTLGHTDLVQMTRDFSASQSTASGKSPELVTLALKTLGHILNEFVRNCSLPYLEDDHPDVRREAALTCCRLFVRDPICYQSSSHAIEVISDVLDKLLTVGIADPDPSIRLTVLQSLHERFDKHLAQAENVRSLFIALNDEVFENRVTAVGLIGRLAKHNPAYVMPSLRKALIQLLTELEYSTVLRNREECTRLLTLLVSATQRLIKPYALPMLKALLLKANDSNPTVAANVLMCLGELACVGGEDALPHVPELMSVIISRLSDPSNIKRDAALHTLGQVCSSTGYVIAPLVDHPQLLQLLGRILRTETTQQVRREVVKVLGILGALDPYRRKSKPEEETANEAASPTVNAVTVVTTSTSGTTDDYYQTVVITSLLAILKDQSLSSHHHTVIEAIMSIFKTQGLKCVTFLPQIIPAFTTVTQTSAARLQQVFLQQLAILIGIIKQHVRNYMPEVFNLVNELWENASLQLPIVTLIEALGKALDAEFKPFLPTILPLVLKVFDGEVNEKRMNIQIKIFDAFLTFGANIEEYLHLVIPIIVKSYERPDGTTALRKKAIHAIDGLSRRVNFSDHASRIVHPLVRVLESANNELRMAVMDTLCSLLIQLGSDFAIFVPTINKCLLRNRIVHPKYENLVSKLLSGERLPQEAGVLELLLSENAKAPEFSAPAEATKMNVNQQHLKQAWDVSQVSTREDWIEWMHRLSVEFMKESPSHALRACMSLVDIHSPLAKELFNAAFISCWGEMYEQYQEDLVRSIEVAITSPFAPSDLIHRLLNLAEFMEHEEKPLPIEHRTLGEYAVKFHAYAKALHYKELEFFSESSPAIIEALIAINTRLQQHDAAWGTLITAREQYDVNQHEEWYERLGRWQEALAAYDKKANEDPNAPDIQIGRMKCLYALGEWDQLATQVEETWSNANHEERREIAPMAAAAAWSLRDWDSMDDYIATMKTDSTDRAFYRAILSVHQNQFPKALTHIAKARDLLDPELTSFVGEGYGRSYHIMVRAQMLSELEEIIAYKQFADQPERQIAMRKTWMKRLQGCQPDVEVWQRILQVRTLVLSPSSDPVMWIKFANLCRKSDRMILAEKTINSLLSPERHLKAPPNVVYAQLKYMWATGAREQSLNFLQQFSTSLARDLQMENSDHVPHSSVPKQKLAEHSRLLARCYFKQGQWQVELKDNWGERNVEDILHSYMLATHYDPTWYKAWHTWALANFDVISHMENQNESRSGDISGNNLAAHVVQAVEGFFRSISLRNEEALQDTLRLLTLWFKFGAHDDVSHAMGTGFSTVEVDTWLDVIPQIIARIQTPSANIRRNINNLLTDVGKHHPQALIYPLTVASKSSSVSRKNAALAIMERMREHSPTIVAQALVVSRELIRVAILWHELWHEGLEEASRLYFTENNPEAMIHALEPLHDMLEAGPTTARETSFAQVFGRDLHEAREACRRYRIYGERSEIDKAWDIYYGVFKKVEKQLPQLTTLDLQYVSPSLLKARNLDLAVPGSYQSGRLIIKISSFATKLTVIASKQRPRRLSLKGSDGRDYHYVLKGHEDLRQDERVMQLFSLVNTLLSVDTDSFKRRLHIQRYPVIPLAPNAGLIGWVQDSDTLHVLVRDYRDSRKVLLNIEYRLMLQMAPDYENLTLLQKVEVFEYALENTTGQDLYRVLWLKSVNSEHWLERRATYTRSLAVNSMVGHILGLGDRHPSNLLLERSTGKMVHIDFGDCFEVAMHREKFPEKVPFRLTRMLTHAMEVSGIEGSFRHTCDITMRVLRDNKESLMAVLEAFVYDPLINWRLMQTEVEARRPEVADTDPERAAYPQGPIRKLKADENDIFSEGLGEPGAHEVRNERALFVYNRVQNKLTGRDFNPEVVLSVSAQVDKLIVQATSLENLCQCFSGWCAFWPNPKHVVSTYLKSDTQTLWSRNLARRSSLQAEEQGVVSTERRGSQVIVIHPGSRWIRIGKASDVSPVSVPNIVARKTTASVPPPSRTENIARPRKSQSKPQAPHSQSVDEYAVNFDSDDPFEVKLAAITVSLRERMRFYKLRVTQNASVIASTFNKSFKPEMIPETNDPFRVDWVQNSEESLLVGEKALRIPDPQKLGYSVKWPICGPRLNKRMYTSHQMILEDLGTVVEHTLRDKFNIEPRDFKNYSVVLVIPDFYDRSYLKDTVNLLLVTMGFKQLCAQQESLAATYGAGITSACVVDIGATKTSIACVDDGLVIADTRITLNMGGDDVTEFLSVLLQRIEFPYRDLNLARSYDWNVMEELKAKLCTLAEGDVALNLHDFVVRQPDKPAEKYALRVYDEIILAPMCIFEPRVIEFDRKRIGLRSYSNQDVTDEIMEHAADQVTQAMSISTQHLMPAPPAMNPKETPEIQEVTNPEITAETTSQVTPLEAEPVIQGCTPKQEQQDLTMVIDAEPNTAKPGIMDDSHMEVIDVEADEKMVPTTPALAQPQVAKNATVKPGNNSGEFAIDVCFEASKLPLDVAIFNSARAAGGDEKIRKYLQAILVVGGTALVPGMAHALESRLQAIATPLVPNMEKVQIIPPPKEVDPRVLAWKGAAVLGKMDSANELWVTPTDWDVLGLRGLKERCFFL